MGINRKQPPLIMRVPDPFDGSAPMRLIRMGILDKDGQLDRNALSVFARIFSGLFFDDLCDFYNDVKDLLEIHKAFRELYEKQDFQHMFILFSLQYDYIRKPLPDPIWWLAGDSAAVKEYMTLFMEHYERFMTEVDFTGQEKEDEKS